MKTTQAGDTVFEQGDEVTVLKSRKIGNNAKAKCVSNERQFQYGAEWTIQVESEDGKTLWTKISNLRAA